MGTILLVLILFGVIRLVVRQKEQIGLRVEIRDVLKVRNPESGSDDPMVH